MRSPAVINPPAARAAGARAGKGPGNNPGSLSKSNSSKPGIAPAPRQRWEGKGEKWGVSAGHSHPGTATGRGWGWDSPSFPTVARRVTLSAWRRTRGAVGITVPPLTQHWSPCVSRGVCAPSRHSFVQFHTNPSFPASLPVPGCLSLLPTPPTRIARSLVGGHRSPGGTRACHAPGQARAGRKDAVAGPRGWQQPGPVGTAPRAGGQGGGRTARPARLRAVFFQSPSPGGEGKPKAVSPGGALRAGGACLRPGHPRGH